MPHLASLPKASLTFIRPAAGIAPRMRGLRTTRDRGGSRRFEQDSFVRRAFDLDSVPAPEVEWDQVGEIRAVA